MPLCSWQLFLRCCHKWISLWPVSSLAAVNAGVSLSEIAGPFSAADVAANCSGGSLKEPLLWVISYALMAICALILVALLLLLVLPCRRRARSGEITDESSLVRHRIKWLRRKGQVNRINGHTESEPNPSTELEVWLWLTLAQEGTCRHRLIICLLKGKCTLKTHFVKTAVSSLFLTKTAHLDTGIEISAIIFKL